MMLGFSHAGNSVVEMSSVSYIHTYIHTYIYIAINFGVGANKRQELIRRGDSKRELFTTISHVLQNTKQENLLRLTN